MVGRRNSEQLLRDMFGIGTLTGHERPVNFWMMEQLFSYIYARGTHAWRNVFNSVKRDHLEMQTASKLKNILENCIVIEDKILYVKSQTKQGTVFLQRLRKWIGMLLTVPKKVWTAKINLIRWVLNSWCMG